MNQLLISFRLLFLMTLILGGAYPLTVSILGKFLSPIRSGGSLLYRDEKLIGSELIAQRFTSEGYFWARPSFGDFDPLKSSSSQRAWTNEALRASYAKKREALGARAPADLLYYSASGLDPEISPEAVEFQLRRVSAARKVSEEAVAKLISRVKEERFLGFMGQPRVNVLELNLLLDKQFGVYGTGR